MEGWLTAVLTHQRFQMFMKPSPSSVKKCVEKFVISGYVNRQNMKK